MERRGRDHVENVLKMHNPRPRDPFGYAFGRELGPKGKRIPSSLLECSGNYTHRGYGELQSLQYYLPIYFKAFSAAMRPVFSAKLDGLPGSPWAIQKS